MFKSFQKCFKLNGFTCEEWDITFGKLIAAVSQLASVIIVHRSCAGSFHGSIGLGFGFCFYQAAKTESNFFQLPN